MKAFQSLNSVARPYPSQTLTSAEPSELVGALGHLVDLYKCRNDRYIAADDSSLPDPILLRIQQLTDLIIAKNGIRPTLA